MVEPGLFAAERTFDPRAIDSVQHTSTATVRTAVPGQAPTTAGVLAEQPFSGANDEVTRYGERLVPSVKEDAE